MDFKTDYRLTVVAYEKECYCPGISDTTFSKWCRK